MTTPPTDQQLDAFEAAARNAARIGSGIDPAAVLELAAEVRRLRAEFARQERLHGDTIDDRDRAQDAADNCPWENALEELHRQRSQAPAVSVPPIPAPDADR